MATQAAPETVTYRWRLRRRLSRATARVSPIPKLEAAVALLAVAAGLIGYLSITGKLETGLLGPGGRTALLVAILAPFMALLILGARRIAVMWLERRRGLMGVRLHVRLVGLFAVLAAVPTMLTVVFASLLFQSGTQFWFSDRAQTVLSNAETVAQAYVAENRERIVSDIVSMGGDLHSYELDFGVESALFTDGVAWQLAARNLSEAVIFRAGESGVEVIASAAGEGALGEERVLTERLVAEALARAATGYTAVLTGGDDRVEAVVRLDAGSDNYLYASRTVDPEAVTAAERAASARSEYSTLLANSRDLEWRFNAVLGTVALGIIAAAILSALWLANRLTRPIAQLAEAAERVGQGDLGARVEIGSTRDELGLLARSFNRMAVQLEGQTSDLLAANERADTRRHFIEAVLEGVRAGIISVAPTGEIELVSTNAAGLLGRDLDALIGRPLRHSLPEFSALLSAAGESGAARGEVEVDRDGETRTFLVRVHEVPGGRGRLVVTFDDITQQLSDQRRAAWADVARRIAHEIKNPLTPIQLAAERLQRRFGRHMQADDAETFGTLTETIVRQVGDLRRMVDEFSTFARMPKPVFRSESVREIAREAIFLQSVAHPDILFDLDADPDLPPLICDRRQLAQAFTNLLKNAAEALSEDRDRDTGGDAAKIVVGIRERPQGMLFEICDNGPGMSAEIRERVTEPYVTTRERGTGLGLAIVNKIVEEHGGELTFRANPGGGTCVAFTIPASEASAVQSGAAVQQTAELSERGN